MIMENDGSKNVEVQGEIEEIEFKIDTSNDKMFHLLSNLYSNPFGSVIKEISTNCNDAHKAANCLERPFQIIKSGQLDDEETLSFRDFGPGMSDSDIRNIYTTFGKSTKTDSNEATGCLGLGSKAPLSISDSFIVENFFNGVKTIYSITKNSSGIPSLMKFLETETKEENGMMVKIPIKNIYSNRIFEEIRKQLKYFKVKPEIIADNGAHDINWYSEIIDNDFKLLDELYMNKNQNIDDVLVQGEVQYNFSGDDLLRPLQVQDEEFGGDAEENATKEKFGAEYKDIEIDLKIDRELYTLLKDFCANYQLKIFAQNGRVAFTPNREELIYNNATVQYIVNLLIQGLKSYNLLMNDALEDFDCMWDFRQSKKSLQKLNLDNFNDSIKTMLKFTDYSFISKFKNMKKEEIAYKHIGNFKGLSPEFRDQIIQVQSLKLNYSTVELKNISKSHQNKIEEIDLCNSSYEPHGSIKFLFYTPEDIHPMKKVKMYFDEMHHDNNFNTIFMIKLHSIHSTTVQEIIKQMGVLNSSILLFDDIEEVVLPIIVEERENAKEQRKLNPIEKKPKTIKKLKWCKLTNISEKRNDWNASQDFDLAEITGIGIVIEHGVIKEPNRVLTRENCEVYELFNLYRWYGIRDLLKFLMEYLDLSEDKLYFLNKKDMPKAKNLVSIEKYMELKIQEVRDLDKDKVTLIGGNSDNLDIYEKVFKQLQNVIDDKQTHYSYDAARQLGYSPDIKDWFLKKDSLYFKGFELVKAKRLSNIHELISRSNFEEFEKFFNVEVEVILYDEIEKLNKDVLEENPRFSMLTSVIYDDRLKEALHAINTFEFLKTSDIEIYNIPLKKVIHPDNTEEDPETDKVDAN